MFVCDGEGDDAQILWEKNKHLTRVYHYHTSFYIKKVILYLEVYHPFLSLHKNVVSFSKWNREQ